MPISLAEELTTLETEIERQIRIGRRSQCTAVVVCALKEALAARIQTALGTADTGGEYREETRESGAEGPRAGRAESMARRALGPL